jgi:hypothetical protein
MMKRRQFITLIGEAGGRIGPNISRRPPVACSRAAIHAGVTGFTRSVGEKS